MTDAKTLSSCHILPHSGVKWCKKLPMKLYTFDQSITHSRMLNRDLRIVMISQACDVKLHAPYVRLLLWYYTHVTVATSHMNGAAHGGECARLSEITPCGNMLWNMGFCPQLRKLSRPFCLVWIRWRFIAEASAVSGRENIICSKD